MKRLAPSLIALTALVVVLGIGAWIASAQTRATTPDPDSVSTSTSAAPSAQDPAAAASPTSTASTSPEAITSPSPAASPPFVSEVLGGHLELDNVISVRVKHLADWAKNNDPSKLVPFIDGRAIRGNYPEEIHATDDDPSLHFHLEMTPDNKDVWIDLLGEPRGIRRPVAFSVGLEGESHFHTYFVDKNPIPLTVISPVYGVVALIIVAITLMFLIRLARTTNLIREPGPCPIAGKLRPYNLGRTQMAFWFFLIYASYLTIWLITGALDTITASLLGLMGISGGTALGEAMIDSGKGDAQVSQLQDLNAQQQSLEQSVPELQAQIEAINTKTSLTPEDTSNRDSLNKQLQDNRTRLAQVNQQIQALEPAASKNVSQGFFTDILSDSSGYSFHRFQIFAWTIVLGVIFISSVYNGLTMPEFSATLLGLMGLSSGTYLGFKFPEQK